MIDDERSRPARRAARVLVAGAALLSILLAGCATDDPSGRLGPPTEADLAPVDKEGAYESLRAELTTSMSMVYPNAELPTPERVRFILPEEWAITMQACMSEQGFGSTPSDDGGLEYDGVPESQALAFEIVKYACNLMYPIDPRYTAELSSYQIQYLFEYYVLDLAPCLEREGIVVAEAPSLQRFRDTAGTASMWAPYNSVVFASQEEWDRINTVCPQGPSDLYGD